MRNYALLSIALVFAFTGALLYSSNTTGNPETMNRFSSEEEFMKMVSDRDRLVGGVGGDVAEQGARTSNYAADSALKVERSSDTNTQVSGIGEPDILKNTGEKIYYSPQQDFYWGQRSNTSVFRTLPAANFSKTGELPANGRMFLTEESIISIGENLTSFTRQDHSKSWNIELNATIEAARKINGSIFLVLEKRPDPQNPCPVRPLGSTMLPCTSFYYPGGTDSIDTTYSVVNINASTGKIQEKTGFTGSSSNTVVYISHDSIFVTYSRTKPEIEIMTGFLDSEGDRYLDQQTMNRIEELRSYDISDESLRREIEAAIDEYLRSMNDEESKKAREELSNAMGNYTEERKRELSTTSIARFNLDLDLQAEGKVPGQVNDRFSLDQSSQGLRIATTVGESWRFDTKPENDLYTLNNDLNVEGSVKGMGLNERIYSVRYVDDRAFVVTFRRVDPFHVIDLSKHDRPELSGTVKLPGFSSYLHPLQEDRILGIGEENASVKAVVFDVSGDEPEVLDSVVLDDYYSEISRSHHAFQIDTENKVFFLPGNSGGHFFSYEEGLEEKHFVNITDVQRGAFVNQYFYAFGSEKAAAVDMENWETLKEIRFRNASKPEPVPLPGPVIER